MARHSDRVRQHWLDDRSPTHTDLTQVAVAAVAAELVELCRCDGSERALDVGCGDGEISELVRRSVAHLDGFDLAPQRADRASSRVPDGTFWAQSFLEPYERSGFDLVFSWGTMQYCAPRDVQRFLGHSLDAAVDGGRVVHADVIDRSKLRALPPGRSRAHDLVRAVSLRVRRGAHVWRDGSVAHDVDRLAEQLTTRGLIVEIRAATSPYRSHLLLQKP